MASAHPETSHILDLNVRLILPQLDKVIVTLRTDIAHLFYKDPMFLSSRLPQHFHPNLITEALSRIKRDGRSYIDLTISNPTRCAFEYPEAALRQALACGDLFTYNPDPGGSIKVREAIAAWHGHSLDPEDILISASTSEAYSWLFKLLGNPGDEFLVPSPSYPLFEWLARLEGVRTVNAPAYYADRWHLDLDVLGEACGPSTRAIILVNPNNPTGHFISREEWKRLLTLCERHQLALIVDEVFSDYVLEPSPDRLSTALKEQDPPCPVFVLSGLSKIAAMPQMKLGWIAARGRQAKAMMEGLRFLADQYLSVSIAAQEAAPEILRMAPGIQQQIMARLRANLAILDQELQKHPALSRLAVEGGWTVLLRRPSVTSDEEAVIRVLNEERVLLQPGHFFDIAREGYLVLSLLGPTDTFHSGLGKALPLVAASS